MIRRATMIWVLLSLVAGVWMFVVKHQIQTLDGELHRLERAIVDQEEAIHVLTAEWSFLNRPGRLDDLGKRLIGLSPMTSNQQTDFMALERALEAPAPIGEGIGPPPPPPLPPGLRVDAAARAGELP